MLILSYDIGNSKGILITKYEINTKTFIIILSVCIHDNALTRKESY